MDKFHELEKNVLLEECVTHNRFMDKRRHLFHDFHEWERRILRSCEDKLRELEEKCERIFSFSLLRRKVEESEMAKKEERSPLWNWYTDIYKIKPAIVLKHEEPIKDDNPLDIFNIFQERNRNYISKDDTVPSGHKMTNSSGTQDDILLVCLLRKMGKMHVVYIFVIFLFGRRTVVRDIPEHCMRNVLRPQMDMIVYKSHSPIKLAAGKFVDILGVLVQSEKIDVNHLITLHNYQQECLQLRNGRSLLFPLSINGNGPLMVKNDNNGHNFEQMPKCKTQDVAILPRQSNGNIAAGANIREEEDSDCDGTELSKHLHREAEKLNCDKFEIKSLKQDRPCSDGFDIREVIGSNYFHPEQVNIFVFPLLTARQRTYFKQVVCYEIVRLWTFYLCENPAHDGSWITELAAAGFYNSGAQGEVACFSCSRWYNNYLAGIPLLNAHEPRCRWRESNKPLNSGTEGIQFAILMDFIKTVESSDAWKDRSRSQNISSASIDNIGTSFASAIPDHGYDAGIARDHSDGPSNHRHNDGLGPSAKDWPDGLPIHVENRSSSSDSGYSSSFSSTISQEASSNSGHKMLTSATNLPYDFQSAHAVRFQTSAMGEDVRDDGTEPGAQNWDLSGASYPQFASREARKESFRFWDPEHIQKPDHLVDLGFFYSGYSDCARCFYCGLGLKYWRPNDDPAYQHARFRPQCLYNKLLKGQEFIERVQHEISQGANPSGNATIEDTKTRFDKSNAVKQAKEEGWTQEYVEEAYKKLQNSASDAGDPRYATLRSFLQEVQEEKLMSARPDSASTDRAMPDAHVEGADARDVAGQIQPLDDHERIRLAEMEHSRLKDRMYCMFCKINRIGCVFLPCGHVVACQECGDKATVCKLCEKHIAALANIYLS